MTAVNHIAGGIAITGITLSFWDINIFSNSKFLSLCIFSALLPDIDHRKSIIGRLFFPISKYLDIKFGHRTITHSLTFLFPIFLFFLFTEVNIINPYLNKEDIQYSLIFLFAYLSHLILDMLTVKGIPLFYPFFKNPCVIPANPSYRFRSGNIRSEATALIIFTMILVSSYDLFKNGFWTSYNRAFGTIEHVFREFKRSENIVKVKYEMLFNGKKQSGNGLVLRANPDKITLIENLDNQTFIKTINSKDDRLRKIKTEPEQTNKKYVLRHFSFSFIDIQSLNKSLKNKIVSGVIQSESPFIFENRKTKKVVLNNRISPVFFWAKEETTRDFLKEKEKEKELKLKQIKLNNVIKENREQREKLKKMKDALENLISEVKTQNSLYQKNKIKDLIILQRKKIENFDLKIKDTKYLEQQIKQLREKQSEATETKNKFLFGSLELFSLP